MVHELEQGLVSDLKSKDDVDVETTMHSEGDEDDVDLEAIMQIPTPNKKAVRRYGRILKPRVSQVIDFENKTFAYSDGSVHINPAVLQGYGYQPFPCESKQFKNKSLVEHLLGVIFIQQHSVRQILRLFVRKGEEAVSKELGQKHN